MTPYVKRPPSSPDARRSNLVRAPVGSPWRAERADNFADATHHVAALRAAWAAHGRPYTDVFRHRQATRNRADGSFADAELAKYGVEDVLAGDEAGDGAEVLERVLQVDGDEIGR